MEFQVAGAAKPAHPQGFAVIIVVHLALQAAAGFAAHPAQLPAFQVNKGVTSGVSPSALFGIEPVSPAPPPHVTGMATEAIATAGSAWLTATALG